MRPLQSESNILKYVHIIFILLARGRLKCLDHVFTSDFQVTLVDLLRERERENFFGAFMEICEGKCNSRKVLHHKYNIQMNFSKFRWTIPNHIFLNLGGEWHDCWKPAIALACTPPTSAPGHFVTVEINTLNCQLILISCKWQDKKPIR